jgi:hypothetical protein
MACQFDRWIGAALIVVSSALAAAGCQRPALPSAPDRGVVQREAEVLKKQNEEIGKR